MTLAIDSQETSGVAHATGFASGDGTLSWSFTNSAGTFMAIGAVISGGAGATTPTVIATYGGVTMTQSVSYVNWDSGSGGADSLFMFSLQSPLTGSNTAEIICTPTPNDMILGAAISFTGASNSGPLGTPSKNFSTTGSATTAGTTLASTTNGNIVISVASTGTQFNGAITPTVMSALENGNDFAGADNIALGYQDTTGGTAIASYSTSPDWFAIIEVEVIAAGGGGGTEYTQTCSTTETGTVSLAHLHSKLLAVAEATTVKLTKALSRTLTLARASVASVAKMLKRTLSTSRASVVSSPKIAGKLLSVAASSLPFIAEVINRFVPTPEEVFVAFNFPVIAAFNTASDTGDAGQTDAIMVRAQTPFNVSVWPTTSAMGITATDFGVALRRAFFSDSSDGEDPAKIPLSTFRYITSWTSATEVQLTDPEQAIYLADVTLIGNLGSANIVSGGTGYPHSSTFTATLTGGTHSIAAALTVVSNSSGVVTGITAITQAGQYSAWPSSPVATTVSATSGSGLTMSLTTAPVNVRIGQQQPTST